ncbi:hypothetical protein RG47T_3825 [Mucilaginibacter polytrichastri]|uniref:Uracil-DNA glycosylase-like domain-containing protein n=2 Tax=Mucilaginibacter polytrichastri TaxID=1302689 RepID=A0A1Q6A2X5_9SPHI|nr:hypothetical protein RG47T_3825 [Mucilaginibacter polytrichastri]SFT14036.1 G/U mismatch-specific uracil-DNA glycosylase [Mucilaginibacter polytrichastri]
MLIFKPMLPDLLAPNLKLVFCGTAASEQSALKQAYYAGPGNKFYKALYAAGLTPHLLTPPEYPTLLNYGIGLTDLVKGRSGMDNTLRREHYDATSVRQKIEYYQPCILCFNGKQAARMFMGLSSTTVITYGLQDFVIGNTKVFIAPSTSGAANGAWDMEWWLGLGRIVE